MSLAERQLEMLRRMAGLDPAPVFMGGYAEDALTVGAVTRPHGDLDWILPRDELDLRLSQAEQLGFSGFESWGDAAPGVPFYLSSSVPDDLRLELGIADIDEGGLWLNVHELFFDLDGVKPRAGYRVRLPDDTFEHPPVTIDGIPIRTVTPLALYQLRVGIASQGSFGELSEAQVGSARRLREAFFSGQSDADLAPEVHPLASVDD